MSHNPEGESEIQRGLMTCSRTPVSKKFVVCKIYNYQYLWLYAYKKLLLICAPFKLFGTNWS